MGEMRTRFVVQSEIRPDSVPVDTASVLALSHVDDNRECQKRVCIPLHRLVMIWYTLACGVYQMAIAP
jgi:hypothetical protein